MTPSLQWALQAVFPMPRGVWVAQGWQSTHVKYRTEGGVVRQLFLQLQIDLVAQLTNI